jgi:hypothetical protein
VPVAVNCVTIGAFTAIVKLPELVTSPEDAPVALTEKVDVVFDPTAEATPCITPFAEPKAIPVGREPVDTE